MAISKLELGDVEKILGRALIDPDFRSKLVDDPEEVVFILGYGEMSEDAIAFFRALNAGEFPEAAQEVEDRLGGRAVIAAWF